MAKTKNTLIYNYNSWHLNWWPMARLMRPWTLFPVGRSIEKNRFRNQTYSKVVSSYKKREQDIDKKYADRGSAGKKQSAKEKRDLTSQTAKDLDLIESYGIDAPKARSFQTQRKKDGGKVRAMKLGGAVMPGRGPKFKGQS